MEIVHDSLPRRTANYKPNIWDYDHLQSLASKYDEDEYRREEETLKEEVRDCLGASKDTLHKLEIIDGIDKLALSHYFEDEVGEVLHEISCVNGMGLSMNDDVYYTSLYFRILRQHGFHVSQDAILRLLDGEEKPIGSAEWDNRARVEVFEASHLAMEDECLLDRAKASKNLKSNDDHSNSPKCPLHWSVSWFNAKKRMQSTNKSVLHRLAGLSFNMIQLQHQKDLKDILRWWKNLGISEVLTFTRDRAVESFLWAVGVAYEPQYGSLRKWLTKAILLVLIIDDAYDIYGSKHEVEQFTIAVERWDPSETHQLPEALARCFLALYNTTNEIDQEIQNEKGWNVSVLPHLKKAWTGFCKALLVESEWYHTGHSPTLTEYLNNGWISSSGAALSLHVLFGVGRLMEETLAAFEDSQELVHHASLIIRLCNDLGTSKAELERGDAPSAILCYMREEDVTEEEARVHIKNLVSDSWKTINGLFIRSDSAQQPMIRYVVNTARVANFIYQNGDGFGVQDRETRDQVLSCLIEPFPLASSRP